MPPPTALKIDSAAAVGRLMRFLAVEGVTGKEEAIGKTIVSSLKEAGVPGKAIRFDDAHTRIPEPTQTGNLIVQLPGTRNPSHPPILFMTHMDTVPLCAGARPRLKGKRIVNDAVSALGGDDRTGCAVLVTMVAELMRQKLDYPPLTLLFTVREESGLYGAQHLNPADLGHPAMAFNVDGRDADEVVVGAIGADRWTVDIRGKAAHAGVAPERGISATMIFALAMAEIHKGGWFGKVVKGNKIGTSNVGLVGTPEGGSAGDATNVVTDFVHVRGESRSHNESFVREISVAYKAAFASAAARVTDHEGKPGKVKFTSKIDYTPFRLSDSEPVVAKATAAVESIGRQATLRSTNGGLDANWMVKHGIPTVTFGAGQNEIHTVKEYVDLTEFDAGCRVALAAATMA